MIKNKLLYFKHESAFNDALRNPGIEDTSIAFIEDTKAIYTHGQKFNTSSNDVNNIVSQYLRNYYTKSQIDNLLSGKQDTLTLKTINGESIVGSGNIEVATTQAVLYTAGLGINIADSTISLKPATINEIGGIRLGYSSAGKTYAVQVDGNNRAYVSVPWEGSTGNGEKGDNGGYYEIIFKACAEGVTPTLPINFANDNEGWLHYVVDDDATPIVWMANRFVDGNGNANNWQGPWRITGPEGEEGADGDEFEYIYARTTIEDSSILSNPNSGVKSSELKEDGVTPMSAGNTPADKDFVPAGWTDNPKGIDFTNKYEWMCLRQYSGSSKTWGRFIGPVLWSAYGRTGTDGDGVEYIYYAAQSGTWANSPTSWTSDPNFLDREYIRSGSGWLDNPVDMSTMLPGAKQWVSVRKRYADENSVAGLPYWHAYSAPALWSYYPHDGDAGIGVVADFDNDMMAISMDSNGMNYAFELNATLHVYNGALEVSIEGTPTILSVVAADGTTISSSYFTIASNTAVVNVNIPANTLDLESLGTIFVTVRATVEINSASVTRDAVLLIIGFKFGSDGDNGCTYSLNVSTSAIKIYKNNTKAPSTISCSCKRTEGLNPVAEWQPSSIISSSSALWDSDHYLVIKYSIDGAAEVAMTSNSISTASISDNVTFSLIYCVVNGGTTTEYYVDREVVYVIQDGSDGVNAINYDIQITASTMSKTWGENGASDTVSGTISYRLQRTEGNNRQYLTNNNSYGITTAMYFGGSAVSRDNVTPVYNIRDGVWTATRSAVVWSDSDNFVEIVMLDSVGNLLASTVVPTRIPGKKGESANIQNLNLAVMRIRTWTANPSPAWNNGSVSENGVYYTDVAVYGNSYYRCLRAGTNAIPQYDGSNDWELFSPSGTAAFEYMIANSAAIQSLTAKQVIVTNVNDVPVAGMIDGQYIPKELTGTNDDKVNTNGIRIFAGLAPAGGNFAETAFTVDESGELRAGKGSVLIGSDTQSPYTIPSSSKSTVFNANGSGQIANGNIYWDANGNLHANNIIVDATNSGFTGTDYCNLVQLGQTQVIDLTCTNISDILIDARISSDFVMYKNGLACSYSNGWMGRRGDDFFSGEYYCDGYFSCLDFIILCEHCDIHNFEELYLTLLERAGELRQFDSNTVIRLLAPKGCVYGSNIHDLKTSAEPGSAVRQAVLRHSGIWVTGGDLAHMTRSQMLEKLNYFVKWLYCNDMDYNNSSNTTPPPSPDEDPSIWNVLYNPNQGGENPWIAISYKNYGGGTHWDGWEVNRIRTFYPEV